MERLTGQIFCQNRRLSLSTSLPLGDLDFLTYLARRGSPRSQDACRQLPPGNPITFTCTRRLHQRAWRFRPFLGFYGSFSMESVLPFTYN